MSLILCSLSFFEPETNIEIVDFAELNFILDFYFCSTAKIIRIFETAKLLVSKNVFIYLS